MRSLGLSPLSTNPRGPVGTGVFWVENPFREVNSEIPLPLRLPCLDGEAVGRTASSEVPLLCLPRLRTCQCEEPPQAGRRQCTSGVPTALPGGSSGLGRTPFYLAGA